MESKERSKLFTAKMILHSVIEMYEFAISFLCVGVNENKQSVLNNKYQEWQGTT